jgi:hypothetical protein
VQAIEKKLDTADFQKVVAAVNREKPEPAQLARLRQYLSDYPALTKQLGNLSDTIRERVLQKMCGGAATQTYVQSYCVLLREEMGYPEASALEQMLIDHIVLCWVRLHDTEWYYQNINEKQHTLTVGDYWERKLSSTQARYLRSIEALSKVRRLMREPKSPVLNMVVAQQINGR